LRRTLLRGLEADPDRRWASMTELLAALEPDPPSRHRPAFVALATTTLAAALLLGARHFSRAQVAMCGGADARLAGIWEREASPRKDAIRSVFVRRAKGDGASLFAGVSGLLDSFVARWATMYRDTCEATHVRGEQSAEVLDLRMACLGQRLGGVKALTDLLMSADASVLENAATAAGGLPGIEACADVEMLRSVVPPPADPQARARVDAIRDDIARVRALGDAGQCTQAGDEGKKALAAAKATGYAPLEAEAAYVNGRAGNFCGEAGSAIESLEDAVFAAEASRHDEVAVEAAHFAAVMYADRLRDTRAARRWLRYCDAILSRLPGHPILQAHALLGWGTVEQAEGDFVDGVREQQRALALTEEALGPLHPDSAIAAVNLGNALHELGRDADAEPYDRRAVETFERLVGPEGAQVALAALDWGEALAGLGRFEEARRATGRALAIWTKENASPFFLGAAQLDLARIELAEKRPVEARRLVEGAVDVLVKQDAQLGAQARFVLAQALWPDRRERGRAAGLARAARGDLVAAKAPPAKVAELDAWLGAHATP
jgi:eukaryotic-like serine/threonine-protein kinase